MTTTFPALSLRYSASRASLVSLLALSAAAAGCSSSGDDTAHTTPDGSIGGASGTGGAAATGGTGQGGIGASAGAAASGGIGATGASAGSGGAGSPGGSGGASGQPSTGGAGGASPQVTALTAGDGVACAALPDGSAKCWGGGVIEAAHMAGYDQVTALGAAYGVFCAISADGQTRCTETSDIATAWTAGPVVITGLHAPAVDIFVAGEGAIVRHQDGTLSAFSPGIAPVALPQVTDAAQLSGTLASPGYYCARRTSGAVHCGDGFQNSDAPEFAIEAVEIAALGQLSFVAKLSDGSVQTFTAGKDPQPLTVPGVVSRLSGNGTGYVCALLDDAGVACGNVAEGALQSVLPAGSATLVAVGGVQGSFACAALSAGGVTCWGEDENLVLGADDVLAPVMVASGIADVFPGETSTVFVKTGGGELSVSGSAKAFLETLTTTPTDVPAAGGDVTWVTIEPWYTSAGQTEVKGFPSVPNHGYLRRSSGAVVRFEDGAPTPAKGLASLGVDFPRLVATHGFDAGVGTDQLRFYVNEQLGNESGQLGNTSQPQPGAKPTLALPGITDVQFSIDHACALTGQNVTCWGSNYAHAIDPEAATTTLPVTLTLSGATSMCTGFANTCGVIAGSVECVGESPGNPKGAIGTVVSVVCGFDHDCALSADGSVHCWGQNYAGQLGSGTRQTLIAPVIPLGLDGTTTKVVGLRAGANHTCALTSSGDTLCWGSSHHGQIGNGVTGVELPPHAVPGL